MSIPLGFPTPGIAARLVLSWVRIYTTGLSDASRERRVGQIHSDLCDHYSDRTQEGVSPAVIGLEALGRAARGAATDLVWRLETGAMSQPITERPFARELRMCALAMTSLLVVSLLGIWTKATLNEAGDTERLLISAAIGGAVLLLLRLLRSTTGIQLPMVFGGFLLAAAWDWTLVGPALAGALVLLSIVIDGRRGGRSSSDMGAEF